MIIGSPSPWGPRQRKLGTASGAKKNSPASLTYMRVIRNTLGNGKMLVPADLNS